MAWASNYIETLKTDGQVSFRPRGDSMKGRIEPGQLCTVILSSIYKVGDIVLCKVGSRQFLHLIKEIKGDDYLICNAQGYVNGWTHKDNIYGVLLSVE